MREAMHPSNPSDPILVLVPFFDWLDGLIDQYGLEIFMVACWMAPFVIAWILCGGLRRWPYRRRIPPRLQPTRTSIIAPHRPMPSSLQDQSAGHDSDTIAFPA